MTRIAHVSDLHFGADDERATAALLADLHAARPEAVVVSGDLTQRARRHEFRAARAFLAQLPAPWLAVPGNHDVPAWNLARRFGAPLARYRTELCDDLTPELRVGEVTILGIATARSNVIKGGRVSLAQMELIRRRFAAAPTALHMLVTHHPFGPLPPGSRHVPVGRERRALAAAAEAGVDVVLAGHLHRSFSADVSERHPDLGAAILTVQAGSAISHRRRRARNAYNVIDATPRRMDLEVRELAGAQFRTAERLRFAHEGHRWTRRDG